MTSSQGIHVREIVPVTVDMQSSKLLLAHRAVTVPVPTPATTSLGAATASILGTLLVLDSEGGNIVVNFFGNTTGVEGGESVAYTSTSVLLIAHTDARIALDLPNTVIAVGEVVFGSTADTTSSRVSPGKMRLRVLLMDTQQALVY